MLHSNKKMSLVSDFNCKIYDLEMEFNYLFNLKTK